MLYNFESFSTQSHDRTLTHTRHALSNAYIHIWFVYTRSRICANALSCICVRNYIVATSQHARCLRLAAVAAFAARVREHTAPFCKVRRLWAFLCVNARSLASSPARVLLIFRILYIAALCWWMISILAIVYRIYVAKSVLCARACLSTRVAHTCTYVLRHISMCKQGSQPTQWLRRLFSETSISSASGLQLY